MLSWGVSAATYQAQSSSLYWYSHAHSNLFHQISNTTTTTPPQIKAHRMPMHYKRTGWLSPKSEDAHVLEQLRTFSSQWLEPNYDIGEQPPHARDEDPKASFLGPPKQQCPDLMLTRAQWGQVKHKRPVSVIRRTPLFSLKRQHTHIGRDLRQFIAGRLVPGMHHGCKGNISPPVPHTKPFVSTHKRTQTPKTPEC